MSDPLLLVVIGVLVVLGVVLGLSVLRMRAELEDIRRQLSLSHRVPDAAGQPPPGVLTPPVDPASLPEVVDLVRRGQKISAIKALRVATGASLRDAKVAVEALERQLR